MKLLEIDCAVQCEIQLVLCFQTCGSKMEFVFFIFFEIIAHFDLLFHQCVYHHFTTAGGGWTPKWKKKTVVCSSCSVKYLLFVQVSISSFVLGWNIFLWQTAAMEIFCSARCTVCNMNSGFCEVLPDEFPSDAVWGFLCTFLSAGGFSLLYQFDGLFCIL